jgi:hypothetical protein
LNVKILQQDTTGTGLPDQWNLNYGFDPTVDNSMTDPDNDGLPNLAELALGTNPHVAVDDALMLLPKLEIKDAEKLLTISNEMFYKFDEMQKSNLVKEFAPQ